MIVSSSKYQASSVQASDRREPSLQCCLLRLSNIDSEHYVVAEYLYAAKIGRWQALRRHDVDILESQETVESFYTQPINNSVWGNSATSF